MTSCSTNPARSAATAPILLISCYELGQQPLSVIHLGDSLLREGYQLGVLDLAVEPFDVARVKQADLIGISVPMHTALRLGVIVARQIRELNPSAHICFYGLYAAMNSDYLLQELADDCFGAECEGQFLETLQTLNIEKRPPQEVAPGFSARGLLPGLPSYVKLLHDGSEKLVGYVASTRGCKHRCLHCPVVPVYHGKFYANDKDLLLAEIRQLVGAGAEHISFGDPDFLNGPRHAERIAREMHREFPDLTFDFTAKIEHLLKHRPLIEEMKTLGCLFVISAVESLNGEVLANIEKGHTRADVLRVLDYFRELGLTLRPSLVPFTPWETRESFIDLLNVVEQQGLIEQIDPIHFSIRLLIPPGSLLLSQPSMKPHLGSLNRENFSWEWSHPDRRMDELQKLLSDIAEQAADLDEDLYETFDKIKQCSYQIFELAAPKTEKAQRPASTRKAPPRLTESWFCCAEPTDKQINSLVLEPDSKSHKPDSCCNAGNSNAVSL